MGNDPSDGVAGVRTRSAAIALMVAVTAFVCAIGAAREAGAQAVEISPAIGYRAGFPSYIYANGPIASSSGAPTYGVAVDLKYSPSLGIEALFSRQVADVVFTDEFGAPARMRVTVDFWHGGGMQEFGTGRVRPFMAGTVGITRYGQPGYSEVRFSAGAGGGVKLLATPHIGARLDGRVYATLVNGTSTIGLCGPGVCILHVHVGAVWQADFTAGVLVAF
jgi:hypothetical protein